MSNPNTPVLIVTLTGEINSLESETEDCKTAIADMMAWRERACVSG